MSPTPSAAHADADLRHPVGAVRFAREAVGAERLVLHLDGGLLTSRAQRDQLPARLVVAAALRSAGHSTVHLPAAVAVPAAWSRVLAAADEVVEIAGPRRRTWPGNGPPRQPPLEAGARPGLGSARPSRPGRRSRRRSAGGRPNGASAARRPRTAQAGQRTAGRTLRAMPLLGPEPPRSARFSAAVVKQVVSRLVDWRINPVIEHVNLLHRAVLDAVGSDRSRDGGAGGGKGRVALDSDRERATGEPGDGERRDALDRDPSRRRVNPSVGKGRIAFVPPRYGDDVVGGAESVLRQAAERLAGRGWEVDVLTTCARDHYTWANAYPPGSERHGDLTVIRFPVVHPRDSTGWQELDRRIRLGASLSTAEQHAWVNGRFRVPGLFHHLVAHAHTYRAIVFSPYLFWTTLIGATVAPERTVVIPCLHDEYYAYLPVFRPLLAGSAQVWFMSEPEHQLAHRIGP